MEQRRDELRAQADLLDDVIEGEYIAIDTMMVEAASGMRGDKDFGRRPPALRRDGIRP